MVLVHQCTNTVSIPSALLSAATGFTPPQHTRGGKFSGKSENVRPHLGNGPLSFLRRASESSLIKICHEGRLPSNDCRSEKFFPKFRKPHFVAPSFHPSAFDQINPERSLYEFHRCKLIMFIDKISCRKTLFTEKKDRTGNLYYRLITQLFVYFCGSLPLRHEWGKNNVGQNKAG